MKHQEFELQAAVAEYLSFAYRDVLFLSTGIALKLNQRQAGRNKRIQCAGFAVPDIIIFEPRGEYGAFFLELKTKSIYKQNSTELLKNDHVEKQVETRDLLLELGYYAAFAWTFESAKELIDEYLSK